MIYPKTAFFAVLPLTIISSSLNVKVASFPVLFIVFPLALIPVKTSQHISLYADFYFVVFIVVIILCYFYGLPGAISVTVSAITMFLTVFPLPIIFLPVGIAVGA
jgi:hypothetical protein